MYEKNKGFENIWERTNKKLYLENSGTINKIKTLSPLIKVKYGFDEKYDLTDQLIKTLHSFHRKKLQPKTPEAIRQHRINIDDIYDSGSLGKAGGLEIMSLGLSLKSFSSLRREGKIRGAIRLYRKENKKLGRYPYSDIAVDYVARSLAIIYYRGTGKYPTDGKSKATNKYRGRYFSFAKIILKIIKVKTSDQKIHDKMLEARNHLQ